MRNKQTNKQTNKPYNTVNKVSFEGRQKLNIVRETLKNIDRDVLDESMAFCTVLAVVAAAVIGVSSLFKSCVNHEKALKVSSYDNKTELLLKDRQVGVNNMYLSKIRPEDVIELKHKYVDEFTGRARENIENYFNDVLIMQYTNPESQQGAAISWYEYDVIGDRMEEKAKSLKGEK